MRTRSSSPSLDREKNRVRWKNDIFSIVIDTHDSKNSKEKSKIRRKIEMSESSDHEKAIEMMMNQLAVSFRTH